MKINNPKSNKLNPNFLQCFKVLTHSYIDIDEQQMSYRACVSLPHFPPVATSVSSLLSVFFL